jgi:hypothetical protein
VSGHFFIAQSKLSEDAGCNEVRVVIPTSGYAGITYV